METVDCIICGRPVPEGMEQEISPSMRYTPRVTCSDPCHNAWIIKESTPPGWRAIVNKLDRCIEDLDPDYYAIVQVKEKFGTLRFYCDFTEKTPDDVTDEQVDALGWAIDVVAQRIQSIGPVSEALALSRQSKLDSLIQLRNSWTPIRRLILDAEAQSAATCELCGEPGASTSSGYWVKTLCPAHAEARSSRSDG